MKTHWEQSHSSHYRSVGGFDLAVTDQRERGCGYCWHVQPPYDRNGERGEIGHGNSCQTEDEAKAAAEAWLRDFCTKALEAL